MARHAILRAMPAPAPRFVILCALVTCLAVGGMAAAPPRAPAAPAWRVHAIRYATIDSFPVRALVRGADSTRTLDIAMMFWLIEAPGRHVLVDAGFYRQKVLDAWKPSDFVQPSEALARFGLPPDSVTDIILTHVHWDHTDGADLFPRARIWIQRKEYEYYVSPEGTPAHAAIDSLDAAMLAGLMKAGRVTLVEGDAKDVAPGITVHTGGKHTFESQYVAVRLARGTAVLASDNMYLYENLDRHVPIAQTLDAASNLAAQDRMRTIASAARLIVPGHDPAVFERFRTVKPGVVRIE